jgi:hypothetical protein
MPRDQIAADLLAVLIVLVHNRVDGNMALAALARKIRKAVYIKIEKIMHVSYPGQGNSVEGVEPLVFIGTVRVGLSFRRGPSCGSQH